MSNVVVSNIYPVTELRTMAKAFADGGLFGFKQESQVLSLMLIAQAENKHPATIAAEYDFIQGKAALKAVAIVSRFQNAGGRIDFKEITDARCAAVFSHPNHGEVTIDWDMGRAANAGLASKENWKKYPRAMLRSRCVSEGVRTILPECLNGFYSSDEVRDFSTASNEKELNPDFRDDYKQRVVDAVGESLPYSSEEKQVMPLDNGKKINGTDLELAVIGALDDGVKLGAIKEDALDILLSKYGVDKIGDLTEMQAKNVIHNINKKIEALEIKCDVDTGEVAQ